MQKKFSKRKILFLIMFLVLTTVILARAGGAGRSSGRSSYSGGSSSGDGGIEILIWLIYILMPKPYDPLSVILIKLVVIGVIVLVLIKLSKDGVETKHQQKNRYKDYSLSKNTLKEKSVIDGERVFKERNPEFSKEAFIKKVNKAFVEIQDAWTKKDLSQVRRYISDSVYQRFVTQFEMMVKLGQEDMIKNLKILSTVIDKYEVDGDYDVIHVGIMADIIDTSVSNKFPELNEHAEERFVEYWSFIRRKGTESYDIYQGENCPSCGAPLGKEMGDVSKCGSCGVITNKGDYDWVLAEITQMTDYLEEKEVRISREVKNKLRELSQKDKDFSVQHIEDKVSNGYIQILKAQAFNKAEGMRRFLDEELFEKLKNEKTDFIYSRLYLNYVKVVDYKEEGNKDILAVRVKSSFKRVDISNEELYEIDGFMKSKVEVVLIEREKGALNKGDLYSHSCPSCGGPLDDTLDTKCPYCSSELTSPKHDWVVKAIVPSRSYGQNKVASGRRKNPMEKNNFSVNEMILNNMLILMYADGEMHNKEMEFAKETAKKLGFKTSIVDVLFDMAKQGRLALKFPRSDAEKRKMLTYMRRAVEADGKITVEEERLLNELEESLR